MIRVAFDTRQFNKDMKNLVDYSVGFLEGVQTGKSRFFNNLGKILSESSKKFIDSYARVNPQVLHHVYEWNKTGSPEARLFDINYSVTTTGLSFSSTFSQSKTIQNGSNTPFYDKARIMEEGIPVFISPKASSVLVFEVDGEEVFTSNDVVVENPGGTAVQGSFGKTFDLFFSKYFTQAFLKSSGIQDYLEHPKAFSQQFASGKKGGKSRGVEVGYKWIVTAGVINE